VEKRGEGVPLSLFLWIYRGAFSGVFQELLFCEREMDFNGTEIAVKKLFSDVGADVFFKPEDLEGIFGLQVEISRIEMDDLQRVEPLYGNFPAKKQLLFF
jgi:hypothetical protein